MVIGGTVTEAFGMRWNYLTMVGGTVSRYGLVVVLAWIGFGKYVKMESRVLIEHSPLMSWVYHFLNVGAVAAALGTAEIVAAVLIAVRPLWPKLSAVGSALAVVLFLGTLSSYSQPPGSSLPMWAPSRCSRHNRASFCLRIEC